MSLKKVMFLKKEERLVTCRPYATRHSEQTGKCEKVVRVLNTMVCGDGTESADEPGQVDKVPVEEGVICRKPKGASYFPTSLGDWKPWKSVIWVRFVF